MQIDRILNILKSGEWHLDRSIANDYYKNLMLELALIEGGASIGEMYTAKRKAQESQFIALDSTNTEGVSETGASIDRIAIFKNYGVMMTEGGMCSDGVRTLSDSIQAAKYDSTIKGAILRVSSGGGQSLAGQLLQNAVKDFSKSKPIIVIGDTIASAAYRGAVVANEIILTSESAMLGSIGSMYQLNKKDIEDYINNDASIYPKESPQKNAEERALKNGDFSLLEKALSEGVKHFHKEVKQHRGEVTEKALLGGMFYAKEAVKIGLADGIGNIDYAVKRLKQYMKQY